jgi:hypothetical protein
MESVWYVTGQRSSGERAEQSFGCRTDCIESFHSFGLEDGHLIGEDPLQGPED